MKHATPSQWQAYISGELPEERCEELEAHLYSCDYCLQIFVQGIEAGAQSGVSEVPSSDGLTDAFADRVMQTVRNAEAEMPHVPIAVPAASADQVAPDIQESDGATAAHRQRKRTPLIRKPLFQYAVAAAITLLLMATGVFEQIGERTRQFESSGLEKREPSFSDRLMKKTTSLLDSLHSNEKGEFRHE